MKITREELERRLNSSGNLATKLHLNQPKVTPKVQEILKKGNDENNRNNCGRKDDVPNAPKFIREVVGICSQADNAVIAAREFGLSNGQARYAEKQNKKLTMEKVEEVALSRLMDTLGLLTVDTMVGEKPKDISIIAANLSRVHSNLRPKESEGGNKVNITLYSPQLREEKDFEVIEVQSA